jgi:hypothetical protein
MKFFVDALHRIFLQCGIALSFYEKHLFKHASMRIEQENLRCDSRDSDSDASMRQEFRVPSSRLIE